MSTIPPPELDTREGLTIVRDDRLPGGTKQRGLLPYMENHPAREFVYASPACGYAQLALAISARMTGRRATVFTAERKTPHPLTRQAHAQGATVIQVPYGYLNVVQKRARAYAASTGACYLPFGVQLTEVAEAITRTAQRLNIEPPEVWTVSGSGTLTRALQKAWPNARFYTVLVGKTAVQTGRAIRYTAPEAFAQPAKQPPPFASCPNYDAKAWAFIQQHAGPGALFWNVAA